MLGSQLFVSSQKALSSCDTKSFPKVLASCHFHVSPAKSPKCLLGVSHHQAQPRSQLRALQANCRFGITFQLRGAGTRGGDVRQETALRGRGACRHRAAWCGGQRGCGNSAVISVLTWESLFVSPSELPGRGAAMGATLCVWNVDSTDPRRSITGFRLQRPALTNRAHQMERPGRLLLRE